MSNVWASLKLTDRLFPLWLRAFVRARAIGLVLVALAVGVLAAFLVLLLNEASQLAHEVLFGLPHGAHLSAATGIPWQRILVVLTVGGALLSLLSLWIGARFAGRLADAIEANALHGGVMSMGGSLYIVLQTGISNGFGAAVGLEAAYTQICSACASALGRGLAARRADIRLLVGCGAAGAIAAAFDAPLAGAFYGFEVVLGAYSVGSLAPVVTSAVAASLISSYISGHGILDIAVSPSRSLAPSLGHVLILAALCAGLGIVVMRGVAFVENILTRLRVSPATRPVIGGVLVAGLAILSPQVMGSGHGALQENQANGLPLQALALVVALKCAGSAISLGAGFRGGLFFASLLIGSTLGRVYAEAINVYTSFNVDPGMAAVAGLASFGAGVLGAPMTMTILALEMTGDFYVALASLVGATLSTLIVREVFGYSFATWRFHLRGESIRGPADIGWMRDLTVGKLMRKAPPSAHDDITVASARAMFPPGSEKQFCLVDADNRFVAVILSGELHAPEVAPNALVRSLAPEKTLALTPGTGIRDALKAFEDNECDVMAVVDAPSTRNVVGLLTEAYALKRYGEELERRHRAVIER